MVEGMTLRDYFAAQVMSALLKQNIDEDPDIIHCDDIARTAYFTADQMLKERADK